MAAVAKWLIGGLPAAAKADGSPAGKTERLPVWIDDLEVALDAKRSIVIYSDLGCRHFSSLGSLPSYRSGRSYPSFR
jgi:hypothetical protein